MLVAVFVPLAFISGLTGQFYNQFALTIAISTVISAINSLTLSPALSALLLKGHGEPEDALTRAMNRAFGWLFRGFNFVFGHGTRAYGGGVRRVLSRKAVMMGVYLVLLGVTFGVFRAVPDGFVPAQDKQYLVGFAQLPDGATLDRTEDVIRRMSDIAIAASRRRERGRLSRPLDRRLHQQLQRRHRVRDAQAVRGAREPGAERRRARDAAQPEVRGDRGRLHRHVPAAAGAWASGPIGGFKLQIEDRTGQGYQALDEATKAFMAEAAQAPELAGLFTSFQVNVPQLYADVDRTKARQLGVPVADVFETLQIYLGSVYVNDFNLFGRTYSVRVQADARFPRPLGRRRAAQGALDHGRDGPALGAARCPAERRAGAGDALQRLPVGRHQRRAGAGLLLRPGAGGGRAHRRGDAAAGVQPSSGRS